MHAWYRLLTWVMFRCARALGFGWFAALPDGDACTVLIMATSREEYDEVYRACLEQQETA
jgi:hypothetical protein